MKRLQASILIFLSAASLLCSVSSNQCSSFKSNGKFIITDIIRQSIRTRDRIKTKRNNVSGHFTSLFTVTTLSAKTKQKEIQIVAALEPRTSLVRNQLASKSAFVFCSIGSTLKIILTLSCICMRSGGTSASRMRIHSTTKKKNQNKM